jgi:multiple sugar transport system permease protein
MSATTEPAPADTSSEPQPRKELNVSRSLRRQKIATVLVYAMLVVLSIIYIYPFLIQLATSFKSDPEAVASGVRLLPTSWTTAAYQNLFLRSDYPLWFRNSVVVTVVVTAGRVFINSLAGYALARLQFRGRGLVFAFLVAIMAVPGVVLLIPRFLVINQLGIYDSFAGMIIPLLADAAGIFIMKNFFESVPVSIEEAARIDGAGPFRTYWSVVLPMATPALITLVILSFNGSWNELSHFIVSAQDPELRTLTKGVAQLASGGLGQGLQYPLKLGAAAIMTIPVAILFFVFQRRIMNVTAGAVKE